ncbi:MAG: sel1 repeat family protein [Neisseriaceae bacterium]|nr:sel1 repeat family protein [Neisseriaceae bacterium]
MKKLFIAFLLLFSFPIFAENLRDLPFEKILTTIDKQCRNENGNKTACETLSALYSSGNEIVNISPNKEKAEEYNFIACQKFDQNCLSYQDYVAQNYLKICSDNANKKLNQMVSCVKLFREEKNKKQSSEITNYIEKQCQEKQFWACFSIFRYYEVKEDKQNVARYYSLLEQSAIQKCEKENYPFICEMFDHGVNKRMGKPKKFDGKWQKLYRIICDNKLPDIGEYNACWLYARNTKTEKEEMEYYDKGCHLGDTQSCISLSALYFSKKDIKSGRDYFGKACDFGNIHGCIIYQNLDKKLDTQQQEQFKQYMKEIISFYFVNYD